MSSHSSLGHPHQPYSDNRHLIYRNVMEALVQEEVDKSFKQVSSRLAKNLCREEVVAFALNRLPALYATSERGWKQQCIRGRRDLGSQITTTVKQAIAMVQREPTRMDVPLVSEAVETEQALAGLQQLLGRPDLTWQNVPLYVKRALYEAEQSRVTRKPQTLS